MPHNDWQQIVVWLIVAAAAWSVGRRLLGQIMAFRNTPPKRRSRLKSGRPSVAAQKADTPLIQNPAKAARASQAPACR